MRPEENRLLDMLDYARRITRRLRGVERQEFDEDPDLKYAITYFMQVIGEAASHVTRETRDQHADVPWTQIVGMRQILVHGYFAVNLDRIWATATVSVPELIRVLEADLADLERERNQ